MSIDPVAEAKRLRAQRRSMWRVARVSSPIAVLGIAMVILGDSRLPPSVVAIVALPAAAASFVTLFALFSLPGNLGRDIANRFRPGSASAYDDE
jgi:hypothetical protein